MNIEKLPLDNIQSDIVGTILDCADKLLRGTVSLDIFDDLENHARFGLHGTLICHLLGRHLALVDDAMKDDAPKDDVINKSLDTFIEQAKSLMNHYIEEGYGKDE